MTQRQIITFHRSRPVRWAKHRDFGTSAKDRNAGQLYSHPADFTLFEIGTYDNTVGGLATHLAKQNLGTALEIRNRMKNEQREEEQHA